MQAAADSDDGLLSSINVTPLVDITLVLLIIFIVTAKIIVQSAVPMDLPQAAGDGEVQTVFSVELAADGKTFVDSKEITDEASLQRMAGAALRENPELRAVIRADRQVQHGRVIGVLDQLKSAHVQRIAFAVTPKDQTPVEAMP